MAESGDPVPEAMPAEAPAEAAAPTPVIAPEVMTRLLLIADNVANGFAAMATFSPTNAILARYAAEIRASVAALREVAGNG